MMPDTEAAIIASHYAAVFNALTQADQEIGDELLSAVNDDLADSDWQVEFDGGIWQAKMAVDEQEDEESKVK
jgi:hypothetical protein